MVQKDVIKEFLVPAVGGTFQRAPVNSPQIYMSEATGESYVLQPPA